MVIEVTSVGNVVSLALLVNFKLAQFVYWGISRLFDFIEELSREVWPCLEDATSVKCSEESALLSPNQIIVFVLHADTVDCVEMRNRDNHQSIVILHVRYTLGVKIVLDLVTKTGGGICDKEVFHTASQKWLYAKDVETFLVVQS